MGRRKVNNIVAANLEHCLHSLRTFRRLSSFYIDKSQITITGKWSSCSTAWKILAKAAVSQQIGSVRLGIVSLLATIMLTPVGITRCHRASEEFLTTTDSVKCGESCITSWLKTVQPFVMKNCSKRHWPSTVYESLQTVQKGIVYCQCRHLDHFNTVTSLKTHW